MSSASQDAPRTAPGPLRVTVRADAVHCFSALTGQRLPDTTDASPVP
ncbi:hypothetical protein ACFY1U_11650 [Streptomyces sp. NPDC001351]